MDETTALQTETKMIKQKGSTHNFEATIEQKIQEENITTWNEMLTALTNAAEETIG